MLYSLIKTVTVSRNRLTESLDLTQSLVSLINKESYLVVQKEKTLISLSLQRIATFVRSLDLTKSVVNQLGPLLTDQFVAQFKKNGLPLKSAHNLYSKRLKVFCPSAYKDYQIHFTSVNSPEIIDDVSKRDFLDDLVIISDHDMSYYLVAVNGVFHRTTYINGKLYVLDGFRTIRISGRQDITVVDTTDLGGHKIVPLTSTNINKPGYHQPAVVSLDESVKGKTLFAVIDGYFYHRDQEVISIADDQHVKINTNRLPLISQFRHNPRTMKKRNRLSLDAYQGSRQYVDDYATIFIDQLIVKAPLLENADFQYSRLTHFHSFLVVMNNPQIYTVSTDVSPTGTPQFYTDPSNHPLSGMISYNCGLCPSYVIWRDPSGRKSIFLPRQEDYSDDYERSLLPPFIPSMIRDPQLTSDLPMKFVDYIVG